MDSYSDLDVAAVRRNRQAASQEPKQSSSPKRPAKRVARFLGDSDSDSPNLEHTDAPVKNGVDLFDGLDEVTNTPEGSNPLAERSNYARVFNDKSDDEKPIKKRRVTRKLDASLLNGPKGFPKLIEDIRRFKTGPKGSETKDLDKLLTIYQLWGHQMYPKTNLHDTLRAVEDTCHKRDVQKKLKEFRHQFKNPPVAETQEEAESVVTVQTTHRTTEFILESDEELDAAIRNAQSQAQVDRQASREGSGDVYEMPVAETEAEANSTFNKLQDKSTTPSVSVGDLEGLSWDDDEDMQEFSLGDAPRGLVMEVEITEEEMMLAETM